MRYVNSKIFGGAVLSMIAGLTQAQMAATVVPDVTGSGKARSIPLWVSATALGSSVITEANGGISVRETLKNWS